MNPDCDRAATVWANVPHEDRACSGDAACTVPSGDGDCWHGALNHAAAGKPEYRATPCGNPASGACPGWPTAARCTGGCCTAERGPM